MQLDYPILIRSLRMAEPGSLISYDDGKLAIVLGGQRPSIFSLNEWQAATCFDEWDEPLAQFDPVCVYGRHFMVRPAGACRIGKADDISLAI